MAEMESARVIMEVVAGLLPGKDPMPEYTKRWAITSAEWADATQRMTTLLERNAMALSYAAGLMARPESLNWVRVDWIWL